MYEFIRPGYYDGSPLPKDILEKKYEELGEEIKKQMEWLWAAEMIDAEWDRLEKTLPKV